MDYKHTRMEKVRKPELTEIKAKFKNTVFLQKQWIKLRAIVLPAIIQVEKLSS